MIMYWNRKAVPSSSTSSSSGSSVAAAGTSFRWVFGRKSSRVRRRRRVMATVRLGGDGKPRQRRFLLIRLVRRARVKWQKLKKSAVLKKLKDLYRSLIRDVLDSGANIEAFHHRLLLETSFAALPVMAISFNSFTVAPSSIYGGLDRI